MANNNQKVIITSDLRADMRSVLDGRAPESIFILADETTNKQCLPALMDACPELKACKVCVIGAGDTHKHLDTLASVWQFLSESGATRRSTMINVGGGMVTDLGGFAASTFKRGMSYINVATTLLGAVDAAVGGKTGINFNGLKNEIGVINSSEAVVIDTEFFSTLDHANKVSGMAEMLKHGLISNAEEWRKVSSFDMEKFDLKELRPLLASSIAVKERIVEEDPTEKNIRKALNFGHTFGHAFESFSHEKGTPALHGYAVAWGMIPELYLSHVLLGFDKNILSQAVRLIRETYGVMSITCDNYDHLFELMTHDKKNVVKDEINFTLLGGIGDIRINQHASRKLIDEAFDFYRDSMGL